MSRFECHLQIKKRNVSGTKLAETIKAIREQARQTLLLGDRNLTFYCKFPREFQERNRRTK